jgi:dTDP-4-amino-4,6-dideoxygalactose transaminase
MSATTPVVPFLDLPLQIRNLRPEIDAALGRVLIQGNFVQGKEVETFEREWAAFCGVPHAVGAASGTDALLLILRGLGIGAGDEVVTVANTFIATVAAISLSGATPVLVDCRLEDSLIDPIAVEAAITSRTKAIIAVHLYGQPADMDTLAALSNRHGIALIEDAAQAHGATLRDGRICGSLGTAAAFSFYPSKNLGALGDGGAVTTTDAELARRIRLLGNLGSSTKYHHEIKGLNSRLDTLQAAVLSVKAPHLLTGNSARRVAARLYREALADCPGVVLPTEAPWTGLHAYHLFVVRLLEHDRDRVSKALGARGVQTVIHYPVPVHLQPAYADLGHVPGSFPVSEALAGTILSLPMFPEITPTQVSLVAEALRGVLTG